MKFLRTLMLVSGNLLGMISMSNAQNCTANAGGDVSVCGSSVTLNGNVSGNVASGDLSWTFVSGPVAPVISSPTSLSTDVTGMTVSGNYIFQLSQPCNTGTAVSQVTVTAHHRPASFTAGPDKTGVCAITGTVELEGLIPSGFTGSWAAVNIAVYEKFGRTESTNASFDDNTKANPIFALVNKSNHDEDPAYYAILTIVSDDGVCTYSDTTIVRFCPNPEVIVSNIAKCIDSDAIQFFDLPSTPGFSSSTPGSSGTVANGTTVVLNVSEQPAGADIAFHSFEGRRIYVTGADVFGEYTFTVTVSNCCGTSTSDPMTLTVRGKSNQMVNFQPEGHRAPEQLALYSTVGTGGEVHCDIAGSHDPQTFHFSIHPDDDPATIVTTVTNGPLLPPGASVPAITLAGADMVNRTVTVDPGESGWKIGTYRFNVQVGSGSCFRSQRYFIHVSDGNRPPLFIPDTTACYPGTGSASAVIRLPDVYQGVVNPSYFQEFTGYYNFQVISRPAGAGQPTFTTSNLRRITDQYTTVSNLTEPGEYTLRLIPISGNGVGPFLEQEYACSGITNPLYYDFVVHLEEKINSNAGSDQTEVCANTASLIGNPPQSGTGEWLLISAPEGATPVIDSPSNYRTKAKQLTEVGQYLFAWKITTPMKGCESVDTVSVTVTCALPISLSRFIAKKQSGAVELEWSTASESNNKGFAIERSEDGKNWSNRDFITSKAKNGNSVANLNYMYLDNAPVNGINFYRLKQMGNDGQYLYSQTRHVQYVAHQNWQLFPNPATQVLNIKGLRGGNSVQVVNVLGQEVMIHQVAGTVVKLDVESLERGLYIIRILDGHQVLGVKNFVKN